MPHHPGEHIVKCALCLGRGMLTKEEAVERVRSREFESVIADYRIELEPATVNAGVDPRAEVLSSPNKEALWRRSLKE